MCAFKAGYRVIQGRWGLLFANLDFKMRGSVGFRVLKHFKGFHWPGSTRSAIHSLMKWLFRIVHATKRDLSRKRRPCSTLVYPNAVVVFASSPCYGFPERLVFGVGPPSATQVHPKVDHPLYRGLDHPLYRGGARTQRSSEFLGLSPLCLAPFCCVPCCQHVKTRPSEIDW